MTGGRDLQRCRASKHFSQLIELSKWRARGKERGEREFCRQNNRAKIRSLKPFLDYNKRIKIVAILFSLLTS